VIQLALEFSPPRPSRRRRLPSERRTEALARLARWLARRAGAPRWRSRELRVVWNSRLRTAVGRADGGARAIELNPRLLDRHPAELVPTLAHELCHLLAGVRAGHGPRWRELMLALGFAPDSCHRLEVGDLAVRRRTWTWRCTGCGETYERSHRGARRFRCGRCGRGLRVDSIER